MSQLNNMSLPILHITYSQPGKWVAWCEKGSMSPATAYGRFPFLFPIQEWAPLVFYEETESYFGTMISSVETKVTVPVKNGEGESESGVFQTLLSFNPTSNHSVESLSSFLIEGVAIEYNDLFLKRTSALRSQAAQGNILLGKDAQYWLDFFQEIISLLKDKSFFPGQDGHWYLKGINTQKWFEAMPPAAAAAEISDSQEKRFPPFLSGSSFTQLTHRTADFIIRNTLGKNDTLRSSLINDMEHMDAQRHLDPGFSKNTPCEPEQKPLFSWFQTYPFQLAVSITEPVNMAKEWEMEIFLQDKTSPDVTVNIEDISRGLHPWKENPVPYFIRMLKDLKEIAPSLREFSLHKGRIRLSRAEVGIFLFQEAGALKKQDIAVLVPKSVTVKNQPDNIIMKGQPYHSTVDPLINWDDPESLQYDIQIGDFRLTKEEFLLLIEQQERILTWNDQWVVWDPGLMEAWYKKIQQQPMQQVMKMAVRDMESSSSVSKEEWYSAWEGDISTLLERAYRQDPVLLSPPASFKGKLRPYQLAGYSWLIQQRQLGLGCCLADDMGLGKTVQTIAYMVTVLSQNSRLFSSPFLLLAPTSLIENWKEEFQQFAPFTNVLLHYGKDRAVTSEELLSQNADVIITSYGLAARDENILKAIIWNGLIFDEAQYLKNLQSKQRKSAAKLKAVHKVALTGTPVENRLHELWSILDLLNRGYLGSKAQFEKNIIQPLQDDNEVKKQQALQKLQTLITPCLLRRKKSDESLHLQLPMKKEQTHLLGLTEEQAALYQAVVNNLLRGVQGKNETARRGAVFAAFTHLKQICNHPAQYLKQERLESHRSKKWDYFLYLLDNIKHLDEKVLVFTQYTEMGSLIEKELNHHMDIPVFYLYGSLSRHARENQIKMFKEHEGCAVFILSLKAGGVGLNLTEATHVIHYDRWWNPAVEQQATDRAYRLGQTSDVTVHTLVVKGTIEDKIDRLIKDKKTLNDEVLANDLPLFDKSTEDELARWFQLE